MARRKSTLTPSQCNLIELMQRINYGRILDVTVRNGEPVMKPSPRAIREVKFGGENGPRPEAAKSDFMLKTQVRELFGHMKLMGDGVISCIEVQHGLPFRMTIEEVIA